MTVLGLFIENTATRGKVIAGAYTQVYLLREDEDGNEERIDISSLVRGADVRLHVGEPVTARLDCFITGLAARTEAEEILLTTFKPRKRSLWRKFRDVTTLGNEQQEYVR